ncbi:hypothetical protein IW150_000514 [Coemansia sp. RSA 2607]|nr:hypothetical protein IW150_000514 [Coemansia sp. RSA 2607]
MSLPMCSSGLTRRAMAFGQQCAASTVMHQVWRRLYVIPATAQTSDGSPEEATLAILKPDLLANPYTVASILDEIHSHNITISRRKQVHWTWAQAAEFYSEHRDRFFYQRLLGYMTSGPILALELRAPEVISRWRSLIGSTHPARMRIHNPTCLRAKWGLTDTRNSLLLAKLHLYFR